MIGIYKITNLINNKVYIGQSINIQERWKAHRHRPFNSNSVDYDSLLYRAIRKYGLANFRFEVLEECERESLNNREIFYIQKYKSSNPDFGYNISNGGAGISATDFNSCLKTKDILEIYKLLETTQLSEQEIAEKFKISQRMVSGLNLGQYRIQKGFTYPIRKKIPKQNYCIDCGKEINSQSTRCIQCSNKNKRTVPKISRDELKLLIRTTPFTKIGEKYGVSDNAVRKWCDKYGLPRKAADIKKITDSDWAKI